MPQLLTGLFPDRETAEHAMSRLQAMGFTVSRMNAEDFDRSEYYTDQMPQGATLITVDADGRWGEARQVMVDMGGREVGSVVQGNTDMPTAMHGNVSGDVPVPDEERAAFAEKAQQSRGVWHEEQVEREV